MDDNHIDDPRACEHHLLEAVEGRDQVGEKIARLRPYYDSAVFLAVPATTER